MKKWLLPLALAISVTCLFAKTIVDYDHFKRPRRENFPIPAAQNKCMKHYERRLPHWDAVDRPLFVTFRLHGSLPINRVFAPATLTGGKRWW